MGSNKLARLAAVGAIVLGVGIGFAYAGGWFSPRKLTPARLIDTFEQINGVHPGFRRNHAKGVCVAGMFESNGQGARLSSAAVFQPGRVPVIGRFAFAIAEKTGAGIAGIEAVAMGAHGDAMVPMPRLSTVAGTPLTDIKLLQDVKFVMKSGVVYKSQPTK